MPTPRYSLRLLLAGIILVLFDPPGLERWVLNDWLGGAVLGVAGLLLWRLHPLYRVVALLGALKLALRATHSLEPQWLGQSAFWWDFYLCDAGAFGVACLAGSRVAACRGLRFLSKGMAIVAVILALLVSADLAFHANVPPPWQGWKAIVEVILYAGWFPVILLSVLHHIRLSASFPKP